MLQKQGAMLELFVSFWRTTSHLQLVIWPTKCKTWLLLNHHRKWWVSRFPLPSKGWKNLLTHPLCIYKSLIFIIFHRAPWIFFPSRNRDLFFRGSKSSNEYRYHPFRTSCLTTKSWRNSPNKCQAIHGLALIFMVIPSPSKWRLNDFCSTKNGGTKFLKLFTGQSLPQFQRWFVYSKTAAPKTAQQKSPLGRIKTNCEGFKKVDTLIWENHVWTNSTQQKQWTRINFEWKNTSVV